MTYCGKINRLKLRNSRKHFTKQQFEQWLPVLERVKKANIQIDDRSGMTEFVVARKGGREILDTNTTKDTPRFS